MADVFEVTIWATGVLLEEKLGSRKDPLPPCRIQAAQRARHHRQPGVAAEEVAMGMYEAPIEAVDDVTPRTAAKVTHLEQVVRPADIRFGRKQPAVCEQGHSVYVGHHDPVVRVHIVGHKEPVDVLRGDFAQIH